MRSLLSRLTTLFHRSRSEQDLDEEFRFHIDTLADEYEAKGLSPEEARLAARRDFGGLEQVKEVYRERRTIAFIETTIQDIRYAIRGLWSSPAFTAAAVLSLTLGIGANTAIFSLLNTLLLRTLPVKDPEQLVALHRTGGLGSGFTSYPLYLDVRQTPELFDGVLARSMPARVRYSVSGSSQEPAFLFREYISANYFEVLGVQPHFGDLIRGNEAPLQSQPVAVLGYDIWQSRFHGDPNVLGSRIVVDDQLLTVIGVARKGFNGVQVERRADIWVPLTMHRARINEPGMQWLWLLARRHPGVPPAIAQAGLDVVVRSFLARNYGNRPDTPWRRRSMEFRLEQRPGGIGVSLLRDQFRQPLLLLMTVVGLILLMACSNVANLLLARGAARRREVALRISLGASRLRLLRQWITETSLLAALGMLGGIVCGVWGSRNLVRFLPAGESALALEVRPDATVILFTLVISVAAVFLFGLLPALRATDLDPSAALKETFAAGSRGGGNRLRKALVVVQVALSVVLLSAATLFSRSLSGLRNTDLGIRNHDVLSFHLGAPRSYKTSQLDAIRTRLVDHLAAVPGVASVSLGYPGPYQGGMWSSGIRVPGSERTASAPAIVAMQTAGARYFETIGSLPLRGRDFSPSDTAVARRVAIVNQSFSREYLNDADPIGRTLSLDDKDPAGGAPVTIIGEVRDILHNGVRERASATVYIPTTQTDNPSDPMLLVRASVDASTLLPEIRRGLRALDPTITLGELRTVRQRFEDSIYLDRMIAAISSLFGALSLLLAGVGIYGVMSYLVAQRTSEIGLRMALGAQPIHLPWTVAREALLLLGTGVIIGVPLAFAGARLAASLIYGVDPASPATFVVSCGVLFAVGLAAAAVPGRRATTIAPLEALRLQ